MQPYFDGRISSIEPALQSATTEINELRSEIESLHQVLDRLGIPKYGANGTMRLGDRFESMLKEEVKWEKIK